MKQCKTLTIVILLMHLIPTMNCLADVAIHGSLTHERIAQPGEVYQGTIVLTNSDDTPQDVRIYPTDYLFYADGRNLYDPPGTVDRSNASWITFSPSQPTIPPRSTVEVNYVVRVPQQDQLSGTYWSMLMVEGISPIPPETFEDTEDIQVGIRTVLRYGIQMVTHLGNTGKRELSFLGAKLIRGSRGQRVLQVDIENIGERWLRPSLWAELYDSEGEYAGRFEHERRRIYPGASVRYHLDLSLLEPLFRFDAFDPAEGQGPSEFQAALNGGDIPMPLQEAFQAHELTLLPSVSELSRYSDGGQWLLMHEGEPFIIRMEEDEGLGVYRLTELPAGAYQALVVADCGGEDLFGATYALELKDDENPDAR